MREFNRLSKENLEDVLELTPLQEGMLFHYLKNPGAHSYFEQLSLDISGEIDLEVFTRAWNRVVEANQALRTLFRWEKLKNPVQVVLKKHHLKPRYHDLSHLLSSEKNRLIHEIKLKDREEKFDLRQTEVPFRVTLCKLEQTRYQLIVSNHHILYDGWSNGIILTEFFRTYADLINKRNPRKSAKTKFREFIKWINSRDKKKQELFWRGYLDGIGESTTLAIKTKCNDNQKRKPTAKHHLTLNPELKNGVETFIKSHKITLAALFYSSWGLLLQRYNNCDDVLFGTTVSGRAAKLEGIEDMVGLFINTLPLRVKRNPNETLPEVLNQVNHALQVREEYETTPLVDLSAYCQGDNQGELFDTLLVLENYPLERRLMMEDRRLSVDSYSMSEETNYDLALSILAFKEIGLEFLYNTGCFSLETIEGLARHFCRILENIIENSGRKVSEIDILSGEEKQRLLVDFNDTCTPYPQDKRIHELFAGQVDRTPDNMAVVGAPLSGGHLPQLISITYSQLNRQSARLAHTLKEKGVEPETLVAIKLEPSLEMIVGILGILKAGGGYLPIEPENPPGRVDYLLLDSAAKVLVTSRYDEDQPACFMEKCYLPLKNEMAVKAGKTPGNQVSPREIGVYTGSPPKTSSLDLAYVIFTSGTTGRPKGVMVNHRSLVNLCYWHNRSFSVTDRDRAGKYAGVGFDASVWEIFPYLICGAAISIIENDIKLDLRRLNNYFEKHHLTVSFLPTQVCEQFLGMDNRSLRLLLTGGDKLRRFFKQRYILVNNYGPTENTVVTTSYRAADGSRDIPIGKPIFNTCIFILDKDRNLLPVEVPGELCIAGESVARGYLNRPELTAEKFCLRRPGGRFLEKLPPWTPRKNVLLFSSPLYLTGDLARWLRDGNIEFLGRLDAQVKIRGYRIELGEIENQLLKREEIEETVVLAMEENTGEKFLCAYIVTVKDLEQSVLRTYLSRVLPDFMVPAYFVRLPEIPLTPNGKVDRNALPKPVLIPGREYAAPRDAIDRQLIDIWAEVLGGDILTSSQLRQSLGIDENFFQLGGHSFKAMQLAGRIHKTFDLEVPLAEIFRNPTLRGIGDYLKNAGKPPQSPINPTEAKEYYPLSSAQSRLYFLQQTDLESTAYNMASAMIIEGDVQKKKLRDIFGNLIRRYKVLRTSYEMIGDRLVQRVHGDVAFEIEDRDFVGTLREQEAGSGGEMRQLGAAPRRSQLAASIITAFIRPFDLSRAPLLRVGLSKQEENKFILMFDMHHIAADGVSIGVFTREFMSLYQGTPLPTLNIQYLDFCCWQNQLLHSGKLRPQEEYWLTHLSGQLPLLDLPTDYERPPRQQFAGDTVMSRVDSEITRALNAFIKEAGVTLFMGLLSVLNVLLNKYTGQEDIIIGSTFAGRNHSDLQQMMGLLWETLALRNYPQSSKTAAMFLQEVEQNTINAYENQSYPFRELIKKVAAGSDLGRNPLFDVMLMVRNVDIPVLAMEGLTLTPLELDSNVSKVDITLEAAEREDGIDIRLEYCTALFKRETMERFSRHFHHCIRGVVTDPQIKLSDLEIMSDEEREQLVGEFNNTEMPCSLERCIHELFETQVEQTPDRVALVGPKLPVQNDKLPTNSESPVSINKSFIPPARQEAVRDYISITYRELNQRSGRLANTLREKGVQPDTVSGIMIDPSVEMIIGIFGILKAGGAYLPIDTESPGERVNYILQDSCAGILLTGSFFHTLPAPCSQATASSASPANLAYIIYTSGSTGRPKGVMIGHRNLVSYVHAFHNEFPIIVTDRFVQQASVSFDVFAEEVYPILLRGGTLALCPKDVVLDMEKLDQFLYKHHITMISCTPLLLNRINKQDNPGFIHTFISGGDVLKKEYVTNLLKAGKVYNTYGPTEATVCATYFRCSLEDNGNIPIGKPIANYNVYILDRNQRLLPIGVPGELCIAGPGIGRGYLNNPELTHERFCHSFDRSYKSYIYHTGDLARWLPEGNVEYLGRMDSQVKIRGYRIEMGEIENRLLKHPYVEQAVAAIQEDGAGEKYLCAYWVPVDKNATGELHGGPGLREFLAKALPGYMIPAYFIPIHQVPLTPQGKINLKALPEPGIEIDKEYAAPRNEIEKRLIRIWSEVLARDEGHVAQLQKHIGIYDNFFHLGGHSLKATLLATRIRKEFQVEFPLTRIFHQPFIHASADFIARAKKPFYEDLIPVEKQEYYSLASAQKRIFFLQQFEQVGTSYNISFIFTVKGELARAHFENALFTLIKRHESLRTSFAMLGDDPVQRIHEEVAFESEYRDFERVTREQGDGGGEVVPDDAGIKDFIRPFDLSRAPLLRVRVVKLSNLEQTLMLDQHHIISDGISSGILIDELAALYTGEGLAPLKIQYKDFSSWQNHLFKSGRITEQEQYWLRVFSCGDGEEIPRLNLPADYPRPGVMSYEGECYGFRLGDEDALRFNRVSEESEATLYMNLTTALNVLLYKYTGQEDIILGTVTAGRPHNDLQPIFGIFVNTQALRNHPRGQKTYREFLKEVKTTNINAYENQDMPFEELVERLDLERDTSRNPLFDICFVGQNYERSPLQLNTIAITPNEYHSPTSKFDLTLYVFEPEPGNGIPFNVEYYSRVFKPETVRRFCRHFLNIIEIASHNPGILIADMDLLTGEEKQQLLFGFNDTAAEYPRDKTLRQLFSRQAARTPARVALVGSNEKAKSRKGEEEKKEAGHLSYRELNERSGQVASWLIEKGVRPDTLVAIMAERSLEMVVGILAILKAGGAYLPMDPEYPAERIDYMLSDSGAKILLTSKEITTLSLNFPSSSLPLFPSSSLAYVIYTSGTTGKPKGVLIQQKNVVRLFFNDRSRFDFNCHDVWTMFHSFCFDFSVWEIFGALLYGGRLILVEKTVARDAGRYLQLLEKGNVTVLNQTPSAFYNLAHTALENPTLKLNLRYVIFGGDALSPIRLNEWKMRYPGVKLINMYGITETTVHVTYKEIAAAEIERNISNIGSPIPTLNIYLLGRDQELVPVGVQGELHVGGEGLARGYLNRPELTSERFKLFPGSPWSPLSHQPNHPYIKLYKSGDLARWLANGEMEYLGRIDHQVQIRGFRIELGEIESGLLKHPLVKAALVIDRSDDTHEGHHYLCAYVVSRAGDSPGDFEVPVLREYLARQLPDYMIPSYFVVLEEIPITPNGKVDRKRLPAPEDFIISRYTAPRTPGEKIMASIWQEVLGLKRVGIDDNFFDVGGDSIKTLRLVNAINKRLGCHLQIVDLYARGTIRQLAVLMNRAEPAAARACRQEVRDRLEQLKTTIINQNPTLNSQDIEDLYPMSDIEKGLVFYYLKHAGSGIYHDQFVYPLYYKDFDVGRFQQALRLLAAKHSILRTGYNLEDFEEPVHLVYRELAPDFSCTDLTGLSPQQQRERIETYLRRDRRHPFEISRPPLWRMRLFTLGKNRLYLIFIFHHAILDGWSAASFTIELHNTYLALKTDSRYVPPPLKSGYKDTVIEELVEKQDPKAQDYWKKELFGYQRLDFSETIKNKGELQTMKVYRYNAGAELLETVKRTAAALHTGIKNLCFSAYAYIMSMFSYENDMVLGCVTNNRSAVEDGDKVLGCFLNTVPVRLQIPGGVTWKQYIAYIDAKMLEVKSHERLTLFEIARIVGEQSKDRNPFYDTLFNFMDFHVLQEARPTEETGKQTVVKEEAFFIDSFQDTNTLFDFEVDITTGTLLLVPKYNAAAVGHNMVEQCCLYFINILDKYIHEPHRLVKRDDIIPAEERERLLYRFNDTRAPYSNRKTMHQLFEEQVTRTPFHTALVDCEGLGHHSYRSFNGKANRLAGGLQKLGAVPGRFVAVVMDRSAEMVLAVMGILKAGAAYVPLEPHWPDLRVRKIVESLEIAWVITTPATYGKIEAMADRLPHLERILCLEKAGQGCSEMQGHPLENPVPTATPVDFSYVIFTSGSTGVPKGVVETHRPVINVIEWVNRTFSVGPWDRLLFVASLGFDLSVYDVFGILASGGCLRVVAAEDIKDATQLLQILIKENMTFWDSAPAALQQLVPLFGEVREKHVANALRLVFLSGDWIPVTMPDALRQTFSGVQVISLGGATEATIWSNYYPIGDVNPAWPSIPYGKPIQNAKYYILDRRMNLCPLRVPGDLYIGGECLASEYKNDPQLTAEKFLNNPFTPGEKIYKTGDIARWFEDGNMQFLGRKDHQVKIRGFRIELGEIESQLLNHPLLRDGIVVDRTDSGGIKYLCAYFVPKDKNKSPGNHELKEYLAGELPEYMIPAYFLSLEKIPLTPNGKVDRQALPGPDAPTETIYTPPENHLQEKLADIWSQVLGKEDRTIGIDSDFFRLGGHSLNATVMISKIHKALKVKLPLVELFSSPTIRELAVILAEKAKDRYTGIEAVEKREYYGLSSAQTRLFILYRMDPAATGYNISQLVILESSGGGDPDKIRLEDSFKRLIHRHESLRTSFAILDNQPVQRVHDAVKLDLEWWSPAAGKPGYKGYNPVPGGGGVWPPGTGDQGRQFERAGNSLEAPLREKEMINAFIRPFDLSRAPLLRVGVVELEEQKYLVMIDAHHIISDGISHALLTRELMNLYAGGELPHIRTRYKDYSEWQKKEIASRKQQEEYWLKQLAGEIPVLNLPVDYSRPLIRGFEGDQLQFRLTEQETEALKFLAFKEEVTLFMLLFSIFTILLSKLSSQEDIIAGTPVAARRHVDLRSVIGMLVNTLVLRNFPLAARSFGEFLKDLKEKTLNAFENQEYPFEELVEKVKLARDPSRNPLFDVMFVLQNMKVTGLEVPGLKLKPYEFKNRVSKFDLTFIGMEIEGKIGFAVEYCSQLFKPETIGRFIEGYKNIVSAIIKDPGQKISEISILPEEDKQRLLYVFNDTDAEYPGEKTLHELFLIQAARTPDHVALVGSKAEARKRRGEEEKKEVGHLSYAELKETSAKVAGLLIEKGVQPDTLVAIMAERSLEMVIGLLGILTAGGAYLPIDPEYPKERINYLLADSSAKIFAADRNVEEAGHCFVNLLDLVHRVQGEMGIQKMGDRPTQQNLAYIIYTSGSTGKPKGVAVEHRSAVNVVSWFSRKYDLPGKIHVILLPNYTFDPSVNQIFGTLFSGAVLFIPGKRLLWNFNGLRQYIERHQVHLLHSVPTVLKELLAEGKKLESVRVVISGGEKLEDSLKDKILERGYRLYNHYGPTEATIHALVEECSPAKVTLGKPIANVRCYILDRHNHLAPLGVPGELGVSGAGVARGYLNRPEFTSERFGRFYRSSWFYKSYLSPPAKNRLYKTGDLARWLPGGNIEFLGRLDYQIKIRGARIEPGEIENQLMKIDYITGAVVIDRENSQGEKSLAAYVVLKKTLVVPELIDLLSKVLPSHMIPSYFVPLEKIPLTPNGKVDRNALPGPELKTGKRYTAPRNSLERQMVEIWSGILAKDAEHASQLREVIGSDDNFFELGGHSLKAALMISRIYRVLNVNIPLVEIFKRPRVRDLCHYIAGEKKGKFVALEAVEEKEYYPLAPAQKRLVLLNRLEMESTAYNMPAAFILEGVLEKTKLENTFKKLIHRHESLRTSFPEVDDEPVQTVHPEVGFEIEYGETGNRQKAIGNKEKKVPFGQINAFGGQYPKSQELRAKSYIYSFIRPFDLTRAPLLRVGLIQLPAQFSLVNGEIPASGSGHGQELFSREAGTPANLTPGNFLLLVDMHHIIADGISMSILVKEFKALYRGEEAAALKIRYRDFSNWYHHLLETGKFRPQEEYWQNVFAAGDEIPVLDLPADYPRPLLQDFAGNTLKFELEEDVSNALKSLALKEEVTLFMLLLAIFNIFLSKLSRREDILVGTPIAARRHEDLQRIIGMFVNTLVLGNKPLGEKPFTQFLKEVKAGALTAFENQEYPFENLVEMVSINRDPGRNPVFDVLFVLQNVDIDKMEIPGLRFKPYEIPGKTSKFDLALQGFETGKHLVFTLEYSSKLFKQETIARFISYFKKIVYSVVEDPGQKIFAIGIIPWEEKQRLLSDFNNTGAEYPGDRCIHRLFEEQAGQIPDHIALVGCKEEEKRKEGPLGQFAGTFGEIQVSYRRLNERSNHLAQALRERGVEPETLVAIRLGRSLDMIIGILAILKAGGAYMPIDPEYPEARLDYMLADSGAKILLTSKEISTLSLNFSSSPLPIFPSSSLAYVIYTSGTTGKPKGSLVTHRNVGRLLFNDRFQFDFNKQDVWTLFHSFCFDFSVWEMYGALLYGGKLVVVPQMTARDTREFLELLKDLRVTILNQTPSAFYPLVSLELNESRRELHLRYVIFGGEALAPARLKEWYAAYPGTRLINMYGITETTVHVTYKEITPVEIAAGTGNIGKPIPTLRIYLIDKYLKLVPLGAAGEICVGGAGVARGYLNRPELSHEKFDHDLADYRDYRDEEKNWLIKKSNKKLLRGVQGGGFLEKSPPGRRRQKTYKSGDLARWTTGGELEYLGRIDQQVKIRGFRIELGEIESRLLSYHHIKEAVVLAREDKPGEKYLCAYFVAANAVLVSELREFLAAKLPDYMIPSYLVPLKNIPLTVNGKVDGKALPGPELKIGKDYRAPRHEVEKQLVNLWAEVLGGIEPTSIGITDNFFELGGHSLKATLLTAKIHKVLQVTIPLAEVFLNPTIEKLAKIIRSAVVDRYASIAPSEKREYYNVSPAQKRLYVLQQMEPSSIGYNISAVFALERAPHIPGLEGSFAKLVQRHESFRASFELIGTAPVQRVHEVENCKLHITYVEGILKAREQITSIIKDFISPFDLTMAPLLRVGLIHIPGSNPILIVDMHHIIADGSSMDVLIKDFLAFSRGEELPGLRIQYTDYSQWQDRAKHREAVKKQEIYWTRQFREEIPVLNLPADYPRPPFQSFAGKTIVFEIGASETAALKSLALQEGATLFMVLLTAYNVLLSKLSGQEEIIVATPIAARRHADLQKIIGMFINTLVLWNKPEGNKTLKTFLQEIKARTVNAYENQEYPFADLVEKASVPRDASRNPLFDTMFILQNMDTTPIEMPGLKLKPYEFEHHTSKFDLTLAGVETGNKLLLSWEYCTKLFKEETIRRFITYYKTIVSSIPGAVEKRIAEIAIIPEAEKRRILSGFNDTDTLYAKDKTLHGLFREQAERCPDQIAVLGAHALQRLPGLQENRAPGEAGELAPLSGFMAVTYRELDRKADRLAHYLLEKGVGVGTIVGIMVERSVQMMIGLLGILKSGAAYLPMDTQFPRERINYMLADSAAALVVTAHDCHQAPPWHHSPPVNVPAGALAYVIYTSGSTGKPKGVVISHQGVHNFITGMTQRIDFAPGKIMLAVTTVSFDIFVLETLLPLVRGLSLVIAAEHHQLDLQSLEELIKKTAPDMMQATPTRMQMFTLSGRPGSCLKGLKEIIVGGEPFPAKLLGDLKMLTPARIYNMYGPTETTVWSTMKELTGSAVEEIDIGKPIANTQVYILDKSLQPQPIGVVGDLYIGGHGLARGYLNQPQLTAERFLSIFNRSSRSYKSYISKKLYRTGDLARWKPDGNIEFFGRIDHQVKIRGFRIELQEIEHYLLAHREIKDAVVIDSANNGSKHLCAYIVPGATGTPGKTPGIDTRQLREHLARALPAYMIPSYFIPLEKIPLTANGKLDRKSLPAIAGMHLPFDKSEEYAAPGTDTEELLARTWKEVLKLEKISIHNNFFTIGGNSLNILQVNSKLNAVFKNQVPVMTMFRYTTIHTLARFLEQQGLHTEIQRKQRTESLEQGKKDRQQRYQKRRQTANRIKYTLNIPEEPG